MVGVSCAAFFSSLKFSASLRERKGCGIWLLREQLFHGLPQKQLIPTVLLLFIHKESERRSKYLQANGLLMC